MTGLNLDASYVSALVDGNASGVRQWLERSISSGMSARSIELEIVAPAMVRIGQLWQEGHISVAQEHLATVISRAQLAWLAPKLRTTPPVKRKILVAGSPGELHALGLQMLTDFLVGDGWDVTDLGPSVPSSDLREMVEARGPSVVGLSTALTSKLSGAREVIALMRSLPKPPVVIVGGAAYGGDEGLARWLGADLFASDAGEASRLLRTMADEWE